jgi:hypothetical protein
LPDSNGRQEAILLNRRISRDRMTIDNMSVQAMFAEQVSEASSMQNSVRNQLQSQ